MSLIQLPILDVGLTVSLLPVGTKQPQYYNKISNLYVKNVRDDLESLQ